MNDKSRAMKILTYIGKAFLACLTLALVFFGTYFSYQAILLQSEKSALFSVLFTSSSIILTAGLLTILYWLNKKRSEAEEKARHLSRKEVSKKEIITPYEREDEIQGLKASRDSYKSMIEGANEAIWTLDRNGKFLSTNKSFEEMTGFRGKELTGRDFSSIVLKESVPLYKRAMADALKGKAETVTIKVLHKYLKPLILSVNVSSILSCGDIIGTVSFARDITIKKTFEEHLLYQNKELSALHKMAASTNYALDFRSSTREFLKIIVETMKAEGGVVFVMDEKDEKFLKPLCAMGVNDEEDFLQSIKGFRTGEGIIGTIALLEEPMTVEDVHEDMRATRPDVPGENFRGFAGAPIRSGGEVFGVLVIYYKKPHLLEEEELNFLTTLTQELALDLGKALFAEETMKETEKMEEITRSYSEMYEKAMEENITWENIFDSISSPICIHDRANLILRTNDAFSKMFGLSPKDLIGKRCHEILAQQEASAPICSPLEEWSGGPFHYSEVRLFNHKHEVYSFPLLDMKRELVGTIHLFIEVDKTKKIREERALEEKLSAISQLVAGVAQELNNPLTGMMGYLQLLLAREDNDTHRTYEEKILKEAEKASKILKNLLTFSRRTKSHKKSSDINILIDKAVESIREETPASNTEIVLNLKSDIPKAMVDDQQMKLVLLNILLNAEQAMREKQEKGKITVNSYSLHHENKDIVRIEIFDEGPGIPGDNLSKIFDPFFTTKTTEKKTGLGLSICSGILHQHGGSIRASNHDRGAVFTIDLPALREEQIAALEKEKAKSL